MPVQRSVCQVTSYRAPRAVLSTPEPSLSISAKIVCAICCGVGLSAGSCAITSQNSPKSMTPSPFGSCGCQAMGACGAPSPLAHHTWAAFPRPSPGGELCARASVAFRPQAAIAEGDKPRRRASAELIGARAAVRRHQCTVELPFWRGTLILPPRAAHSPHTSGGARGGASLLIPPTPPYHSQLGAGAVLEPAARPFACTAAPPDE